MLNNPNSFLLNHSTSGATEDRDNSQITVCMRYLQPGLFDIDDDDEEEMREGSEDGGGGGGDDDDVERDVL